MIASADVTDRGRYETYPFALFRHTVVKYSKAFQYFLSYTIAFNIWPNVLTDDRDTVLEELIIICMLPVYQFQPPQTV